MDDAEHVKDVILDEDVVDDATVADAQAVERVGGSPDVLVAKLELDPWRPYVCGLPSEIVTERAYLPTAAEVARARDTVERLAAAVGPDVLGGGEFVDTAMLGAARQTVAIADRYGTSAP